MPVLRNVARRAQDVVGSSVSVLLRASAVESTATDKQRDVAGIRNLGVEIVQGDLVKNSVDELASIFANYDTVIGCTGITAGLETPMKVAQAALQAKLPRYFPWQFGVDFDVIGRGSPHGIFDSQLDVQDLLRSQNETEWVIISTGIFMNYLFEPGSGMVDLPNNTVNALGSLDIAVTAATPEDIGVLTAEILFTEPRIRNEIVYLAGDTITYRELAETLEAVLQRQFQIVEWTVPFLLNELAKDPDDMTRSTVPFSLRAEGRHGRRAIPSTRGTRSRSPACPSGSRRTSQSDRTDAVVDAASFAVGLGRPKGPRPSARGSRQ